MGATITPLILTSWERRGDYIAGLNLKELKTNLTDEKADFGQLYIIILILLPFRRCPSEDYVLQSVKF